MQAATAISSPERTRAVSAEAPGRRRRTSAPTAAAQAAKATGSRDGVRAASRMKTKTPNASTIASFSVV